MVFDEKARRNQQEHFAGIDVDWFGFDENGSVGYFTSAGKAPIPSGVIERQAKSQDILSRLRTLPVICEAQAFLEKVNVAPGFEQMFCNYREDLINLGKRGIYCFDATENEVVGYRRLIVPTSPLHVSTLPEELRAQIEKVKLKCIFSAMAEIL